MAETDITGINLGGLLLDSSGLSTPLERGLLTLGLDIWARIDEE